MKSCIFIVLLIFLFFAPLSMGMQGRSKDSVDHSIYSILLEKYVKQSQVDYRGFKALEDNTLYISKIFKWFSEDFHDDVVGFFLKYAQGDLKKQLEESKSKIKVKYLDYDWSLNGK